MKVEYINPFVLSTKLTFAMMLGCDVTRGELFVRNDMHLTCDISGVIGLSGKATGTVVLNLDREAALAATEVMLQERPPDINADVADAIGELTNVVAGQAKAQLEQFRMSVSLPTVITGGSHCIQFPSGVTPVSIPFHCPWGQVVLEVGLIEKPSEAFVAGAASQLAAP